MKLLQKILVLGLMLLASGKAEKPVYVAYTANLNGNLQPCNCQAYELGSMVRLATAIEDLRTKFPDLLLVDSGDFLKSYPIPAANRIMAEFMTYLNFSAITPGDQELVEGSDFFYIRLVENNLPLVACNIQLTASAQLTIPKYVKFEQNGVKLAITGIIHPESFDFIPARGIKIMPVEASLQSVLDDIREKVDVIILIYHAGYRDALALLEQFKDIDVILSGHSQERYEEIIDGKIILQPGYDGEYLGLLEIQLADNELKYQNQFIEISERFPANDAMMQIIKEYNETLDQEYY